MKLLFDENLSHRLPAMLMDLFPDSTHVRMVTLKGATDAAIWEHAKHGGFIIVTKDTDFVHRSATEGCPPKVVFLDAGNAGTEAVAVLLRARREAIRAFVVDEETALLVLPFRG